MRDLIGPALLLSFLYLPLGGCSGPVEPPTTRTLTHGASPRPPVTARTIDLDRAATPGEAHPGQPKEFFVWTREGEERTVTYQLDESGRSVAELEGIVIATNSGTWQWQVEDRSVHTVPCEYYDDEGHVFAGEPVAPGAATRASLRHLATGTEQVVVEPGIDLIGNADVKHDVGIVASIGPYVFVEESTYLFSCGAHGTTGVSSIIWNVATGTMEAAPTDLGPLQTPRALAIADLVDEDDDAFAPTEENLELTELLPRFTSDGSLVLGLQFTAPTCYACTRGGWSSYTKSAIIDAPATPVVLAPFASAPQAVRMFLRAHPEVVIKGWSAR